MGNEALVREVSRRLSPGISADLGAGWFEGLAKRNRYGLIARQVLWDTLDCYVATLDDEQFKRSLVFLRRAFGEFSPNEKRNIAENLAEVWGVHGEDVKESLDGPLTQLEEQALEDLNDLEVVLRCLVVGRFPKGFPDERIGRTGQAMAIDFGGFVPRAACELLARVRSVPRAASDGPSLGSDLRRHFRCT
jgi:hypothetical protein